MSVSGVTSPSMLNAVRASRTATLNDVHPRYASFPIRPARLSPTRCQNSTTPSAPAFSIMSSIRDARATSITGSLRPWASHERTQDLLESSPPLLLRLGGNRVPFEFPEAVDDDCHEPPPVVRRHVRGRRADLVVRHRDDLLQETGSDERAELRLEVLRDLLVLLELLRLAELFHEQDPGEPLHFPRDGLVVGGEDLRGDRLGLEQMADDDRRLEDVREDALHLRDLDGLRRQEDEERAVADARNDDRAGLELLDGHHHVLPAQLIADMRQIAFQEVQQAVFAWIELVRDRRREDAAVDAGEHRNVEAVLLPCPPQLRLQEVLQMADRVGPHRLVDLAGIRHLAAPLQPVRVEQDLEGFLRRIVVIPAFLHPSDPLDDPRRGFHPFRGLDRVFEDLSVTPRLLIRDLHRARADDDAHAAGEEVRIHALAVVDAPHLQQLQGPVERATDRVVFEVNRAVGQVDWQEDVLADRLPRSRVLFDRTQDDSEFLERVEQLADQLALLQLLRGGPDHGRHRIDHDARRDVVVRAGLHELGELLLDHFLEIAALEVDEEQGLLVVLPHVEAHQVRLAHDLLRRFLEGPVQRLLPLFDALHQELNRERGLARPAGAQDHDRRLGPESAFDHVVESRDSGRHSLDVRHGDAPSIPRPSVRRAGPRWVEWAIRCLRLFK